MSPASAAARFAAPRIDDSGKDAAIAAAAASAFSRVRDPSTIGYPALPQRSASPEPRSPVPPMMARVGRSGISALLARVTRVVAAEPRPARLLSVEAHLGQGHDLDPRGFEPFARGPRGRDRGRLVAVDAQALDLGLDALAVAGDDLAFEDHADDLLLDGLRVLQHRSRDLARG